jgi:hypothetical protein
MKRTSKLGFGIAAAAIVGLAVLSYNPTSSAETPLSVEQQKMLALVDKSVDNSKGMMFNTKEMGGVTIQSYSAQELKQYRDEVIKNVKSGEFVHVVTCDANGRNCAPNTTLMAPELNR